MYRIDVDIQEPRNHRGPWTYHQYSVDNLFDLTSEVCRNIINVKHFVGAYVYCQGAMVGYVTKDGFKPKDRG